MVVYELWSCRSSKGGMFTKGVLWRLMISSANLEAFAGTTVLIENCAFVVARANTSSNIYETNTEEVIALQK